jgi:hypothetical protein
MLQRLWRAALTIFHKGWEVLDHLQKDHVARK